jgi:uncharacterized protein (DUF2235 family)
VSYLTQPSSKVRQHSEPWSSTHEAENALDTPPEASPERNLVVCCDGTNDQFGAANTNVVTLFTAALKRATQQAVFYDPGVGTFSSTAALTPAAKQVTKIMGSAFGYGVSKNIADSYGFLSQNFQWNDRIFLFGFSRGAYAVRALAALIHACGLLHRQNQNLIPYAIELFKSESSQAEALAAQMEKRSGTRPLLKLPLCDAFAAAFSAKPQIHFLGLWDTVTSVGSLYNPLKLPFTRWNPSVRAVRHAVSIDERRKFFRQNLWSKSQPNVTQVWFAGVHADVGGGYPPGQNGLSQFSLSWMLAQAQAAGLLIDPAKAPPAGTAPSPKVPPMHDELTKFGWKLAQLVPRQYSVREGGPKGKFVSKWKISPLPQPRFVESGSRVHRTVFERMRDDESYRPPNLPDEVCDENGTPFDWKSFIS